MKERIKRRFWRAADSVFESDAKNLERELQRIALRSTAEFIMQDMPSALSFRDRFELLKYALHLAKKEGLFLEFGVYRGKSINFMAQELARFGLKGHIYGFDSFEGLPEDWRAGYHKGIFKTGELPAVESGVILVKGLFETSLPGFVKEHKGERVSFVHVDCDLYSSTKSILQHLSAFNLEETMIVFDEYFNFPGWQNHEHKAFQEFIKKNDMTYSYVAYNKNFEQVAVMIHSTGSNK